MPGAQSKKHPAKKPAASIDLEAELARIAAMNINELRTLWREREGKEAPRGFSKDLTARALAYAIQEEQLGGLCREVRKLLSSPDAANEAPRRIKPGSVIVREYAGARHEVFVVEDGFSWEGKTYPSLSAIAKEITGTRWNGWRFFGLRRGTGIARVIDEERRRALVKKLSSAPKQQRCAIYTRKSTEHNLDLAFNSLDAQREACEAYIKSQAHEGWKLVPTHFDDGGLSGASLNRPALQSLLDQVRAKRIDIVVVYKVDRLTRSLADFAKLVELFDEHEVSFVSVTQSFNTTSSMGRLTLNVLLSFAQFEREVIGERVRDKIAASKRKGIWVGGMVPLGYRAVNKKLEIVPEEADLVCKIFALYIELGSVGALASALDQQGARPKPRQLANGQSRAAERYTTGPLAHMLKNRFYVGEVAYRGEVHKGEHPAIVDREVFDRVQAMLAERSVARMLMRGSSPHLLTGLMSDDRGNPMSPTHANKKGVRYRYYTSHALLQCRKEHAGSVPRVSAPEVEALV